MKAPKPAPFRRDPPDLPSEFDTPAQLFTSADITLNELHLKDLDHANLATASLRIEGSVLERIQLSSAQLGAAVWKDARLIDCDLANVLAHRISLVRVEFINCRLTGFRSAAIDFQDVLFEDCDLRYAQLQNGRYRSCEFVHSNLQDADLQQADLSGSILRACNLAQADLRGANLRNTDLRASDIETTHLHASGLQGAIVNPAQALTLARLLGLQIR